jgi:CubicO group peptidase (beta-lactamase class C family)
MLDGFVIEINRCSIIRASVSAESHDPAAPIASSIATSSSTPAAARPEVVASGMARLLLVLTAVFAVSGCSACNEEPRSSSAPDTPTATAPDTPAPSPTAEAPAPAAGASSLPPETIAAIDEVMSEVNGRDRPGCALGVVQNGALVLSRGYGMANVERGEPITASTVFDLASTSKQMTAAAIFLLAGEGTLTLDDLLSRWVPELSATRGRPIRIRDLVHHVSGLPDYLDLLQEAGSEIEDVTTGADALAAIVAAGPSGEPGVEFEYNNSNYFLMAEIVARATRRPFEQVMAERLFRPLGMASTVVSDGRTRPPRMATGYAHDDEGRWVVARSGWQQVGDGAVMSTVEDLARWDEQFYTPRVGGPALVAAMLEPGALDDGTELTYAGGLELGEHGGHATVAHDGSWLGFGAQLVRFPDDRTSVICLCNFDDADPDRLALAVADIVLGTEGDEEATDEEAGDEEAEEE